MVEPETYLHYIQTPASRPSASEWVPYDDAAIESMLQDFKRLWATGFLDDSDDRSDDYPFANGIVGKLIVYRIEERQRIKIVSYEGIEASRAKQAGREASRARPDDPDRHVRRSDPHQAQSRPSSARCWQSWGSPTPPSPPDLQPLPGGPKAAHLTFTIDEGPQTRIRRIEFDGNSSVCRRHACIGDDAQPARALVSDSSVQQHLQAGGLRGRRRPNRQLLSRSRLPLGESRPTGDPRPSKIRRWKSRWVALGIPVTEGHAIAWASSLSKATRL